MPNIKLEMNKIVFSYILVSLYIMEIVSYNITDKLLIIVIKVGIFNNNKLNDLAIGKYITETVNYQL